MKAYIDTSVFGGYFDIEFEAASKLFFEEIEKGIKKPVISDLTYSEIQKAPLQVRELYNKIEDKLTTIKVNKKIVELADAYVKAGALTQKSIEDAIHIASATVKKVDVIVSWNFKHIVNLNRILIFNKVNIKMGYTEMEIRTPIEVLEINK
ncbi:MAG: PIN domain protein [Bacteroidota bacterium]